MALRTSAKTILSSLARNAPHNGITAGGIVGSLKNSSGEYTSPPSISGEKRGHLTHERRYPHERLPSRPGSSAQSRASGVADAGTSSRRLGPIRLLLFLEAKWLSAALEGAGGRAPARVRTVLLALAYNLELETAVLTHVDLPQFHLVTVGHVRLSTFVRSLGDLAVGQP